MAEKQPIKKRKLRPANTETLREQTVKAQQARQQSDKPKRLSGLVRRGFSPFLTIGKVLKWLGRHVIPKYFRNAFKELRGVTWPTRKESRQLTTAVILFAIVFGFFIAVVDYGLDKVFRRILLKQ